MSKALQCRIMVGQMTFYVRSGSKNPLFLRLLPGTHWASLSCSFMMVMDLTTHLNSLNLLMNTTSFSFAYHPIPHINSNLLISVSLVHFHVHGQNDVMKLLRILQKKCLEKILLRNIQMCSVLCLSHQQYEQLGGKVAAGPLIPPSSKMMTLCQVSPLPPQQHMCPQAFQLPHLSSMSFTMMSRTWAWAWATTMNTTRIYQILTQSQAQALSSMMIMTTSVNHAVRTTCLQMPLLFQHQQHLISHHQLLSPQYQKLSPLGYSMH